VGDRMDHVGLGLFWTDLKVGQTFRTINRTITEAEARSESG